MTVSRDCDIEGSRRPCSLTHAAICSRPLADQPSRSRKITTVWLSGGAVVARRDPGGLAPVRACFYRSFPERAGGRPSGRRRWRVYGLQARRQHVVERTSSSEENKGVTSLL
jgi:hypothetical protein